MPIAVVLLHYNRLSNLRFALRALKEQTLPLSEFHIVVADDGSTDGTADEMRRLIRAPEWEGRLHFVTGGPHHEARITRIHNIGIANIPAECTFFVLLASDMCLAPDALEQIATLHKQHPQAVMITRLDWLPPMTHSQIEAIWDETGYEGLSKQVPQEPMFWSADTLVGLETRPLREKALLEPFDTYSFHPVYGIPTELFWCVGGYDENMVGYGWQELEFALRLQQQSIPMITTTEIRALHIWHMKDTEIRSLVFWQRQKNTAYMMRKHAPHIKILEFRNWKYWEHYHHSQGGKVFYRVDGEAGLLVVNEPATEYLRLPHAGWLYPLGFSVNDVAFVQSETLAAMNDMGMAVDWLNECDFNTLVDNLETLLMKRLEDWRNALLRPREPLKDMPSELFQKYDLLRVKADQVPGANLPVIGFGIRIICRVALAGKVWAAERELLYALIDEIGKEQQ